MAKANEIKYLTAIKARNVLKSTVVLKNGNPLY
jgi:hypothetical protein